MSAAIRSNTRGGSVCPLLSGSSSRYQYGIVRRVWRGLRERACVCMFVSVLLPRRSKLGWPACMCVLRSRSQRTCLFRKFAGDLHWWINGGRAVVQKTLWGRRRDSEREWEREKARGWREVAAPSRLPVSKNPAGADWRSLGVAWGGEEGGKGGRVDTTRTKQRQATGSLCVFCVGGWRGSRSCGVLWLRPATSTHHCYDQRATEGEDSLFDSAACHHAFRWLLQCNRLSECSW